MSGSDDNWKNMNICYTTLFLVSYAQTWCVCLSVHLYEQKPAELKKSIGVIL